MKYPTLSTLVFTLAIQTLIGTESHAQPVYQEHVLPHQFIGGGEASFGGDDLCVPLPLEFDFKFYDIDFTGEHSFVTIYVCSNGLLALDPVGASTGHVGQDLVHWKVIAPLWQDLGNELGGGLTVYIHQPTDTTLVIRWDGLTWCAFNDPDCVPHPVNVEVILNSVDGSIRFNYGPDNTGLNPSVGISEGGFDVEGRHHFAPHHGAAELTEADSILYTRTIACSDGLDNDSDGAIDYPDDIGCDSASSVLEQNPWLPCDNGLDDDGDGAVDMDDPDCPDSGWLSEEQGAFLTPPTCSASPVSVGGPGGLFTLALLWSVALLWTRRRRPVHEGNGTHPG